MSEYKPPLRARLYRYLLTSDELLLLQVMVEHCSDGSTVWASVARLAAYSKLSERTVQRLIQGLRTSPEFFARGGRKIWRAAQPRWRPQKKAAPQGLVIFERFNGESSA